MNWYELESQIYDLETSTDQYVESCNIVFIIPEIADGSEEYYVYYDDTEKPKTQYEDHVSISESYYRYEPISGYPLESSYYKIEDDGIIPYIVSQEGQFMGYNTGQHVQQRFYQNMVISLQHLILNIVMVMDCLIIVQPVKNC